MRDGKFISDCCDLRSWKLLQCWIHHRGWVRTMPSWLLLDRGCHIHCMHYCGGSELGWAVRCRILLPGG